jgi:WXG100 family type VII secretion target
MSEDGQLLVNFATLHKASDDIQSALGKMRSTLSDLEQAARPLVDTWDGQAKAAYAQRQETWRRAADDLAMILNSIKTAVDDSAADYHQTERSNTQLFA